MKDEIQAELLDVFNELFDAATSADIDGELPPHFTAEILDRGRAILFRIQEEKSKPVPPRFTFFYCTFSQIEERWEFVGFKEVVGTEEAIKTAKEATCPNCEGDCRPVAMQNDEGTVRNFAVCEHCDTAMEF